MAKQLQFYELATPINAARHGDWAVRLGESFAFAADATTLPIMHSEFAAAAPHAPIVFLLTNGVAVPVIVTALQAGHSLFTSADGAWTCPFVPAVLKRYPFVFSHSDDGATLTLCIDEAFGGIDRSGASGERLFDATGGRTAFLDRVLSFVTLYQREHNATLALAARLVALDLLEPTTASMTLGADTSTRVTGFHCISRDRLAALDDATIAALLRDGTLELIHLHLASLNAFATLAGQAA